MYDVFLMLQRFLKRVYVYSTNQTKTENLESISKNKVFKIENFPNPWLISQIPTLLTPLSFPHWAICNPPLDKLVSGLHVGTSLDIRPAAFSSSDAGLWNGYPYIQNNLGLSPELMM